MLTGYQCEVIAFATDGEIICAECATQRYGEAAVAAAERGLDSAYELSPLIRYTVDEYAGERQWEYAGERVDRFVDEHPQLHALLALNGERQRELIDRWAEHHEVNETCGECGGEIK